LKEVASDPRSYTPKHLADKILQSKSALEACPEPGRRGERKQVTVMFADVKGSMELAEQLDPEAWHAILDRFFAILTEGVHRFEGTVNQYTGDGIMALFGAPIAHEGHAQRACYTALHESRADAAAARDHARRALEMAEKSATPRARMVGLMLLGIAHRLIPSHGRARTGSPSHPRLTTDREEAYPPSSHERSER
jgi:class 3 adenylate cyclase